MKAMPRLESVLQFEMEFHPDRQIKMQRSACIAVTIYFLEGRAFGDDAAQKIVQIDGGLLKVLWRGLRRSPRLDMYLRVHDRQAVPRYQA